MLSWAFGWFRDTLTLNRFSQLKQNKIYKAVDFFPYFNLHLKFQISTLLLHLTELGSPIRTHENASTIEQPSTSGRPPELTEMNEKCTDGILREHLFRSELRNSMQTDKEKISHKFFCKNNNKLKPIVFRKFDAQVLHSKVINVIIDIYVRSIYNKNSIKKSDFKKFYE